MTQLLTLKEMAPKLAISWRGLQELTKRRLVPVVRLGRNVRYNPEAVAKAVEKLTIREICPLAKTPPFGFDLRMKIELLPQGTETHIPSELAEAVQKTELSRVETPSHIKRLFAALGPESQVVGFIITEGKFAEKGKLGSPFSELRYIFYIDLDGALVHFYEPGFRLS